MSDGELMVVPDSVILYGEAYKLSSIDKVFTEPIKHQSVTSDIQGVVRLEKIKDVRLSVTEVHYLLDVSRYIEMKVSLPVKTINVPADRKMTVYPSSADVVLKMAFPLESEPSGLELHADYNYYVNSLSGICPLVLSNAPKGLISYEVDPVAVNCVLEDR
jgi:hypothetical protein